MTDDYPIPHNLDAERAVLGAVLVHNEALDTAAGVLSAPAFYRKAHQCIFAAMLDLQVLRQTIDFVTLTARLTQRGELDTVGGPAYITSLVDGMPLGSNVEHHAQIVREKATLRQLQAVAASLLQRASAAETPALEVLADADAALMTLAAGHVAGDLVPASALMHALFPVLEQAYLHKRAITGLQTAWRDLDELTLGLQPGTLWYLAGRTSQGKSALSLNLAADIALQGHRVAYFSLEDSREQIAMRLAAAHSGVSLFRMRSGYLVDRDWAPISNAIGQLGASGLYVDDSARLSVQELRAKCRRLQGSGGLDLVFVDYVQCMYAPGKHQSRAIELGIISKGLKQIAKELRLPVVAAAQLNREPEKDERRPRLSDLRESGALEQDADVVVLLHRPAHDEDGLTEVILAKQRNGPTGTVKLRFVKEAVRFVSWIDEATPVQREFAV